MRVIGTIIINEKNENGTQQHLHASRGFVLRRTEKC